MIERVTRASDKHQQTKRRSHNEGDGSAHGEEVAGEVYGLHPDIRSGS
jgi:hypothetical protein